jgi:DNA polymerase III subunit delta'
MAFNRIIGQNTAIALLKSAITQDRIAPAYLFTGIEGIGRKLTALAFAEAVINDPKSSQRVQARNHPDLMWVEPTYLDKGKLLTAAEAVGLKKRSAPQIRLEQIRAIGQFLSQPPLESKRSLVIIEEAQTMPEAAANGLLKTLEEPGKATIILIAPNVGSLLPTLVSRCQRIPFYTLTNDQLKAVLSVHNSINQDQNPEIAEISPEIIDLAQGSPGQAIANFSQLQTIPPQILTEAQNLPNTPQAALSLAKNISKELELETQIWLLSYLQNYLWRSLGQNQMPTIKTMQSFESAKQQLKSYVQPRLVWEVLLLGI